MFLIKNGGHTWCEFLQFPMCIIPHFDVVACRVINYTHLLKKQGYKIGHTCCTCETHNVSQRSPCILKNYACIKIVGVVMLIITLQRKFHLCIPFLGIAWPQSQFPHSCVCERFIYSQDRSTHFLQQNRQINCGNI
jgi:hypothetical protein